MQNSQETNQPQTLDLVIQDQVLRKLRYTSTYRAKQAYALVNRKPGKSLNSHEVKQSQTFQPVTRKYRYMLEMQYAK